MFRRCTARLVASTILVLVPALFANAQEQEYAALSKENVEQLQEIKQADIHADKIFHGPNAGELLILKWGDSAEVIDAQSLKSIRPIAKDHQPSYITVSPDGKLIAWTERNSNSYTIEELATGKRTQIQLGDHPSGAAFSPDGEHLAIGNTYWDPDSEGVGHAVTNLYDTSGKLIRTLQQNGPGGVMPRFSPDGKKLAVGNRNYKTQIFDVKSGELLVVMTKRMTQDTAFSPDGKILAEAYVDGSLGLCDVQTGVPLRTAASGNKELYCVDWSPDGKLLATSGRQGNVIIWDAEDLAKLQEFDVGPWAPQVRFSKDGTRLMASSSDTANNRGKRKLTVWAVPKD